MFKKLGNLNSNIEVVADGDWSVFKFKKINYYIAFGSWSSTNYSINTPYDSVYTSPTTEISLPQNVRTVSKIICSNQYLGGTIGGVTLSDNRQSIDVLTPISFWFWGTRQMANVHLGAYFVCFGNL